MGTGLQRYYNFLLRFNGYYGLVLLFKSFCRDMGPRKNAQEVQGGVSNLYPFYAFPTKISREVHNQYINRLRWLHSREFSIVPTVNWNKLREVGLLDQLNPFLTKTFMGNGISFTCRG